MLNWPGRLEEGLFRSSRTMAAPWGPILRALRYPVAIARDWLAGEINVRAMSLAYTTLLSLVPLMVFSFSILKTLGAHGDLRYLLHQFFRPLGPEADRLTEIVMQFVTNMRGDVLGFIGFAFLFYTVINTVEKVEASFNFVWRVEQPRSLGRRITEYLTVIALGPVLLAVVVGLLGSARHSNLAQLLDSTPLLAWLIVMTGKVAPYAIVAAVFTFMYAFIPNTHVRFRPALIGGVTAGIIWALVGRAFAAFLLYSSQMLIVYTGFAIVLTTLIWVYLSWLILLIGAQLAMYVQWPQYLPHGHHSVDLTGGARERAALSVMCLICSARDGANRPWTVQSLSAALDVPGAALTPVLACLARRGLLVALGKDRFETAGDCANIRLTDVIDAVRTGDPRRPVLLAASLGTGRIMSDIESAIHDTLGDRSLGELTRGPDQR